MINIDDIVELLRRIAEVRELLRNLSARTDIVLTPQGPRGVGHESIETDILGIEDLPGGDAAAKFRMLPPELRRVNYYDNHHGDNRVLIVLFHGLGLDQDDFKSFLLETDAHCLAPTLYGFHPSDSEPVSLPLVAHSYLMARFVEHYVATNPHKRVVLVGFSTGADLMFALLEEYLKNNRRPFATLLMDTNITRETCFISGQLSAFTEKQTSPLALARELLRNASTLQDWLDMSSYLVRVLRKFENNLALLGHFADDVVSGAPRDVADFAARATTLLARTENARFVFSKSEPHERLLSDVTTLFERNRERFPATWEKKTSHFGLQESSFLAREVARVLAD